MVIGYAVAVAVTTTSALIWRALLLDHEKLLAWVRRVPFLGPLLSCGFCTAIWLSLVTALLYNPLEQYLALHALIELWVGWFTLCAGVLFLRNLIALLMEANGVVTDTHRKLH